MVLTETLAADAPTLTKSFYSPAEVAELASLSSSTILNYIRAGKLAAVRLSERTYRIPRRSVALLLGLAAAQAQIVREPDREVAL
jgi:excisionase family DNA binding protein